METQGHCLTPLSNAAASITLISPQLPVSLKLPFEETPGNMWANQAPKQALEGGSGKYNSL